MIITTVYRRVPGRGTCKTRSSTPIECDRCEAGSRCRRPARDSAPRPVGFVMKHQVNAMRGNLVLGAFRGDQVPTAGEGTTGHL
jgi:hypothetical protein